METDLANDHALSMTVYGHLQLAHAISSAMPEKEPYENRNGVEYAFITPPRTRVPRSNGSLSSIDPLKLSSRSELLSFINYTAASDEKYREIIDESFEYLAV